MSVRDSQRGFKWNKIHYIERFGCDLLLNGRLASGFIITQNWIHFAGTSVTYGNSPRWFIVTGNTEPDVKRQEKSIVDGVNVAQKFRWISSSLVDIKPSYVKREARCVVFDRSAARLGKAYSLPPGR